MSDEAQRVLERRARALARRAAHEEETGEHDHVVFRLARETYALDLACLRHVFPLVELALLPGAEPPLVGLTAWRGELIRVLDLTRVLGIEQGRPTDRGRVLVLGDERSAFAFLADAIVDVARFEPAAGDADGSRFIRAVTADAIAVLDGAALIETFA